MTTDTKPGETMNFDIKNRRSGNVQVSVEIECSADAPEGVKLGLAVKMALKSGADLRGADLRHADLRDADLRDADLRGAKDVPDFTMPDGLLFSVYLKEVVPALLTAGGRTVEEIVSAGAWDCHDWTNCPMAMAFGVHNLEEVPPLYRARAKEFVQFFDSGLIPRPITDATKACKATGGKP